MIKDNLKVIRKVFITIIFILLLIIFFSVLVRTKDNTLIKNIKDYISTDVKVVYVTSKEDYSKYPIDLFKKYDVDYFYINSDNLSNMEKLQLQKIINSNYLSNIIVIYEDGIIKDAIIEYDTEEKLRLFLSDYSIIPSIIGDNSNITGEINNILQTDYSILYLPYEYSDVVEEQDKILKEISKEYDINYYMIDAYLLSKTQQDKLNLTLKISQVYDQIVILVKDKKIVGSIREENNKIGYLNKLNEFLFIDEIGSKIKNIDYSEFSSLLNSENKSVIVVGKDDCKYCEDLGKLLNSVSISHNIDINYINIKNMDFEISKKVEKDLLNLGYSDGFTTPITIIVEKNKLLDYVIGLSNEKYFVDIFTENGIIK